MRQGLTPSCSSGWVVFVIGTIAVFSGIKQGSAATMGLGLTLLLITLYLRYRVGRAAARVELTQDVPGQVSEAGSLTVKLKMRNASLDPFVHLRFSEWPDIAPSVRKRIVFSSVLEPGEYTNRQYTVKCEVSRGRYNSGRARLRISDFFGFFERSHQVAARQEILVLPRVVPLSRALLVRVGMVHQGWGTWHRLLGQSQEFHSAREYRHQDPKRSILWKHSARRGTLIVRENFRENRGGLVILLDISSADRQRHLARLCLDQAARLAASLLHRARSLGDAPRLLHNGLQPLTPIHFRQSHPLPELLQHLAVLNCVETPGVETLLREAAQKAPGRCNFILVTRPRVLESLALKNEVRSALNQGHDLTILTLEDWHRTAEMFTCGTASSFAGALLLSAIPGASNEVQRA